MTVKIIPTVLAFDPRTFRRRFEKIVPIADEIQVDFMDGRFVQTKSITLEQAPSVKRYRRKTFEAHLMVKDPLAWVPWLADKGFKRMILHYEAIWPEDIPLIRKFMDREGVEFFLAINPDTPVERIVKQVRHVHGVLFLGVIPGRNNAPYVEETPDRIRSFLASCKKRIAVQVDGGMSPETVHGVVEAGCRRINTGHYVTNARDPARALKKMAQAAEAAR